MNNFFCWSSASANLLALGVVAATISPMIISTVALAQNAVPATTTVTNFGDVAITSNLPATNYIVGEATGNDIVSLAAASNSFSTLTSLLKTAGLVDTLQQPGPYTIFAPTNEAFAALPPDTLQQLQQPENRELLIKILRYHVVPGELTPNQLSSGDLKTVEDSPVNIRVDTANNQITVNEARVIQPNIQASNGVIYPIDQILIPPNLTSQQPQNQNNQAQIPTNDVTPGRATRGGSSYVGVAGNIGLGGDTALSESNLAVISKIGLTRTLSVRPSAIFGDDTVFLVPLTLDFAPREVEPGVVQQFSVSPYVGAGVAIEASGDADLGFLLTGGVDVPLGNRFTLMGAVNAAFVDETDVGLLLGVGYNF